MKDAIIGAITKYTPKHIEPWVKSIAKSGFTGDKFMLVYEVPQNTIDYLQNNDFTVFDCGSLDRPIVVRRFLDLYSLLTRNDFNYNKVIVTDVKDVIFQLNPSLWLSKNLETPIVVGSESILSKDMEWAVRNYGDSYPLEWPRIKDKVSFCAGVIAGEPKPVADLFLNIFRWSLTGATPYQSPDQAALNVLMDMEPYKSYIQKTFHKDTWVTHLGISLDKPELHGPFLQDSLPQVKDNLIVNSEGLPFTIVHQYDRIPSIESLVLSNLNK